MPTYEQQSNGTFKGVARVHGVGKRAKCGFTTKVKALAWAADEEDQMRAGKEGRIVRGTLADALKRYREEVSPSKRGSVWEIRRLTGFLGESKRKVYSTEFPKAMLNQQMSKLTTEDFVTWREKRLKYVGPASLRRDVTLLKAVFKKARREWKFVEVSPLGDLDLPPEPKPRKRRMSDEERDRICLALGYTDPAAPITTKSQQVALILLLALETMMRSSEITTLTWEQVDLDGSVAHLLMTKNGDDRDVPLSRKAIELLKQAKTIGLAPDAAGDHPVFDVSPKSRDVLFRKARDRCKITGVTFHDSRATALTRLAKKLSPLELAKMSGHRDPKSLMTYYREDASTIAAKLD